jgi:hypothetical protein
VPSAPVKSPSSRKWTETKRLKFATALGAVVLTLVFAEGFLRVFVPQEAKRITIYDPDIGWRSEPLGEGRFVRESEGIDVEYSFNSLGFRSEEWPAVDRSARRLVLLGDSMLEALEVHRSQSAPALVEAQLGPDWQTTLVACRGWSPGQELLAFRKYGLEREPEVVVLGFFTGNDFSDNLRKPLFVVRDGELVHQPVYAGWGAALYQRAARWAYINIHLAFHFKHAAEQAYGLLTGRGRSLPLDAVPGAKDQELVRRLLLQLNAEVETSGAKLVVAILPTSWEIEAHDHRAGELVAGWLEEADIPALPLFESMTREMYFQDDPHLSPAGHRFVAKAIASEWLQRQTPHSDQWTSATPR